MDPKTNEKGGINLSRKQKVPEEQEVNLYYFDNGQEQEETIDDIMKRKKAKEREKRIGERKKQQL